MTRSSYRYLTSLILTFLIQGVFAANIVVNTTTDDENAGDGKCTLREAINNANIDSDNTEGDCKKGKGLDTVTSTGEIGYISLDSPLKITEKIQFRGLSIDGAIFEIINYFSDVGAEFTKVSLSGGIIENNGGILTIKDSYFSSLPIINENGGITIKNSTLESGSYIRSYYDEWSEFGPPQGTYIEKSTFRGNSGNEGGAITQRSLALTIVDSTFSNNFGKQGGALYLEKAYTTIINSTFSGNSATKKGGAIFNQGSFHWRYEIPLDSYLDITNSTFSNNSAPIGGGIFNDRDYYVDHEIIEGDGCSICQEDYENNREFCDSECWFLQDAITEITEGKLSLKNTIIANSEGGDCYNDGSLIANSKNFIGDGSCNSEYSGDPNLGPLANNGGFTETHMPLEGSMAIDAGDNTVCPEYDQRGTEFPRPIDENRDGKAVCDIGSVEVRRIGCDDNQHATFSLASGKLTIPLVDIPENGKEVVYQGQLLMDNNGDFKVSLPTLKSKTNEVPNQFCHAVYSSENKTLTIPFVEVHSVVNTWPNYPSAPIEEDLPINVLEVTFDHVQVHEVLKDYSLFRLKNYRLLSIIE